MRAREGSRLGLLAHRLHTLLERQQSSIKRLGLLTIGGELVTLCRDKFQLGLRALRTNPQLGEPRLRALPR